MSNKNYKLMIVVVDRGLAKKVQEILHTVKETYMFITIGSGTANSEILDYLGLGETEKDIIFTVMDSSLIKESFELLNKNMNFTRPGHGIAFTISLNSISGKKALKILTGDSWEDNNGK